LGGKCVVRYMIYRGKFYYDFVTTHPPKKLQVNFLIFRIFLKVLQVNFVNL